MIFIAVVWQRLQLFARSMKGFDFSSDSKNDSHEAMLFVMRLKWSLVSSDHRHDATVLRDDSGQSRVMIKSLYTIYRILSVL